MRRRVVTSVLSAFLLVAVTGGAVLATRDRADSRDPVAAAVDALPDGALTADVTVWSRIRGDATDASLRDVATRSTLAVVADEMRERLGWGPTDLAWESYATVSDGSVTVMALDDVSNARVRRSWDAVGDADGTDAWDLTGADVSPDFATTFARVRLLPSRHVLVAGSTAAVDLAVDTIEGGRSLLDLRPVADVVRRVGDAASVLLQSRVAACRDDDLADDERAELARVADTSGALVDPRWVARALHDDTPQRLSFVMAFGSPEQARGQLAAREPLTSGRFVGRTGDVADSLRDLRATVDGEVVDLDFRLTPEAESFMSAAGPVVFSGCAVPSPA